MSRDQSPANTAVTSGHTPGPWSVDPLRSVTILCRDLVVARSYEVRKPGSAEANARLIAAAPDLLFALKNLLATKNGEGGTVFDSDEIARSAISKATGEA